MIASPPTPSPRQWVKLDSEFLSQDTIIELRAEHGPAGPLVMLALILEKRRQGLAGKRDGSVEMRYGALAVAGGCDKAQAEAVLRMAADLGLVVFEGPQDPLRFRVTLPKGAAWDAKDPHAAARSKAYRDRQAAAR